MRLTHLLFLLLLVLYFITSDVDGRGRRRRRSRRSRSRSRSHRRSSRPSSGRIVYSRPRTRYSHVPTSYVVGTDGKRRRVFKPNRKHPQTVRYHGWLPVYRKPTSGQKPNTRVKPVTAKPTNTIQHGDPVSAGGTVTSPTQIRNVKRELTNMIRRDRNLVPKFVQLCFHDCWDGCDGCFDEKDPSNEGLLSFITTLRTLKTQKFPKVSFGDIVSLAGVSAVEFASDNNVRINFIAGRREGCAQHRKKTLPVGSVRNPVQLLKNAFPNLSDKEGVALMGAHSIGNMHSDVSGFGTGPWDLTHRKLDNGIHKDLIGENIQSFQHDFVSRTTRSTQWKGTVVGGSRIFMMHCDMALVKRFTVSNIGSRRDVPNCQYNTCPRATTAKTVEEFARSNSAFLRSFKSAYQKMINNF